MNSKTPLYRQVHPSWFNKGEVTSQVFIPTPKDSGALSVYNGDILNAEEAYRHFTEKLRNKSCGSLCIKVIDCNEESLNVIEDNHTFWGHALIQFFKIENDEKIEFSKGEIKKIAKKLKMRALKYGNILTFN